MKLSHSIPSLWGSRVSFLNCFSAFHEWNESCGYLSSPRVNEAVAYTRTPEGAVAELQLSFAFCQLCVAGPLSTIQPRNSVLNCFKPVILKLTQPLNRCKQLCPTCLSEGHECDRVQLGRSGCDWVRKAPLSCAMFTLGEQENGPQGNVVVGVIWSTLGWSSKKKWAPRWSMEQQDDPEPPFTKVLLKL